MPAILLKAIRQIEATPFSLGLLAGSFVALIVARLAIEFALQSYRIVSLQFLFFEFTHTFFFFLCAFLLFVPVIATAGGIAYARALPLALFGFLVILFPPVIDTLIFRDAPFWSFYEFDGLAGLVQRYFTFFGDTPQMGITWGVRVEVALAVCGIGIYTYLKRKRIIPVLGALLVSYSIFFVLGTFPSYFAIALTGLEKGFLAVTELDVAALFLTPEALFARPGTDLRGALNMKMSLLYAPLAAGLIALTLFRLRRADFFALLRNARFPQIIYHAGLLFLGMLLAVHFGKSPFSWGLFQTAGTVVLLAAVILAWLASVIVNDLFDTTIDVETNPFRPLPTQAIDRPTYTMIGWLFFIASLLFAGIVSFSALLLLLAYQSLAFLYSAPFFRLKRIPVVASFLSACAVLLVFFVGYTTVHPERHIASLPLPLTFLLLGAFSLVIPLKDFKDIAGDRRDGVLTLPVLLGAERAKQLFAALTFFLFPISARVLNISQALIPALLLGGSAAYLILISGTRRLPYRFLPGAVLTVATGYGFVLLLLAA